VQVEHEIPTFAIDILQDVIDEGEREFELTQKRNSQLFQKEKTESSEDESGDEPELFPPLGEDFTDWNEEIEPEQEEKEQDEDDEMQETEPPVVEEPKELARKKRKIFLDD
jgi:hypothetical protein